MRPLFPCLLSILLLTFSCREPSSSERFIQGSGPYAFTVDMRDSSARYDLDIFTRIDAREWPSDLQIQATWTSPSQSVFRESVWLPLSAEVYAPYRADMQPSEAGVWTLVFTIPSPPEGFRGLGLVIKKKWDTEN